MYRLVKPPKYPNARTVHYLFKPFRRKRSMLSRVLKAHQKFFPLYNSQYLNRCHFDNEAWNHFVVYSSTFSASYHFVILYHCLSLQQSFNE